MRAGPRRPPRGSRAACGHQLRMLVGLREVPGVDAGAEPGHTVVRDRLQGPACPRAGARLRVGAALRQQAQEVALAGAVGAQHRHPVAVPDLQVEREGQVRRAPAPRTSRRACRCARRRASCGCPDPRRARRRPGLLELRQPRLRGPVAGGHAALYAALFLYMSMSSLSFDAPRPSGGAAPRTARGGPRGRRARTRTRRVGPGRAALDRDDLVAALASSSRSWRHVEDRLGRLAEPLLQPALAGHVEEVVGLVEQQHLVAARSSNSSANRFCSPPESVRERTVLDRVPGSPSTATATRVAQDLDLVAARLAPGDERLRVRELVLSVPSEPARRPAAARRDRPHRRRGEGEREVGQRAVVGDRDPTNWLITPSPPLRAMELVAGLISPATTRTRGPARGAGGDRPDRRDTRA